MGRKAKMKPHTAELLDKALKECEGSEENVRRIYNTLVTDPEEQIPLTRFQRFVRRRLDPIHACYAEERFPTLDGQGDSIVLLPRWKALMEWQAQASPTWASALEECLQTQQDTAVHPIIYTDDITCGNILAPVKLRRPERNEAALTLPVSMADSGRSPTIRSGEDRRRSLRHFGPSCPADLF